MSSHGRFCRAPCPELRVDPNIRAGQITDGEQARRILGEPLHHGVADFGPWTVNDDVITELCAHRSDEHARSTRNCSVHEVGVELFLQGRQREACVSAFVELAARVLCGWFSRCRFGDFSEVAAFFEIGNDFCRDIK